MCLIVLVSELMSKFCLKSFVLLLDFLVILLDFSNTHHLLVQKLNAVLDLFEKYLLFFFNNFFATISLLLWIYEMLNSSIHFWLPKKAGYLIIIIFSGLFFNNL